MPARPAPTPRLLAATAAALARSRAARVAVAPLAAAAVLATAAPALAGAATLDPVGQASRQLASRVATAPAGPGARAEAGEGLAPGLTPLALYQRWIDDSLAPTPPGRIRLVLSEQGCAWRDTDACTEEGRPPTITFTSGVYDVVAHYELMHEVAHVFDFEVMTPRLRGAFERIMGLRAPWWSGAAPPAEEFAMGYGYCALSHGPPDYRVYWGFGYHASARQQRRVCRLVRRAARQARARRARARARRARHARKR